MSPQQSSAATGLSIDVTLNDIKEQISLRWGVDFNPIVTRTKSLQYWIFLPPD